MMGLVRSPKSPMSLVVNRRCAEALVRWGLLSVYAGCCLLWWVRVDWIPQWDSAIYILAGQSIAHGDGYSYLQRPFFLRPPGFSWLLSFFLAGGEISYSSMNRLVMTFAAASVVMVYVAFEHVGAWTALSI